MDKPNREPNKIRIVNPSPRGDEEPRQWLKAHIEQRPHLTTAVLSKRDYIGVSRTALDQYLDGTWFLPKEAGGQGIDPRRSSIEDRIQAYREEVEGTVRHGRANTFVETRTYSQIKQACDTAIQENAIVVAYGRPGVGKTRSLKEYSILELQGTLPIHILATPNFTTRFFIQKVARGLGLSENPSTAARFEISRRIGFWPGTSSGSRRSFPRRRASPKN